MNFMKWEHLPEPGTALNVGEPQPQRAGMQDREGGGEGGKRDGNIHRAPPQARPSINNTNCSL